jgi:hypothetical protein
MSWMVGGCGLTVRANVKFVADGYDEIPGTGDEPIAGNVVTNNFTITGRPGRRVRPNDAYRHDDLTLRDPYFEDSAGKSSSSPSTYIFGTEELAGGLSLTALSYANSGTITTTQVLVTDTVPSEVEVIGIRVGPSSNGTPVQGRYQTNNNPGVWVDFPQNPYSTLRNITVITNTTTPDQSDIELAADDFITAINYQLGEIPASNSWNGGGFDAIVDPSLVTGVGFDNCAATTAYWDEEGTPIPVNHNACAGLRVIDERAIP